MATKADLTERVSARIDEVVPKGDNVEAGAIVEAPINFMNEELDRSAEFVLRMAPVTMVKQAMKKASFHFPLSPSAFNGAVSVGGTSVVNQNLTAINNVVYNINGEPYGSNPMPVTVAADPTVGTNRRDIVVGNSDNVLEYVAGTENSSPDLLDFPAVPSGKVLIMKVVILDDGAGGFTKTYTAAPTSGSSSNPSVRVIAGSTPMTYVIPVPQDFFRFINIQLSTWSMPVMELMKQEDPKYRMQKNNKQHRGTEVKPIAALIGFSDYVSSEINSGLPNKNLAIECFTSETAPTLTELHYVPKRKAEELPDDLLEPMIWMCAARTLKIMRQNAAAEVCKAQVEEYFGYKFGFYGEEK